MGRAPAFDRVRTLFARSSAPHPHLPKMPTSRWIQAGACALALSLAAVRPAAAQDGAVLRGQVVDDASGLPVASARVEVEGAAPVLADSLGRFRVGGLRPRQHRVRVERLGYARSELRVQVADSLTLSVRLVARPETVAGVTATAPAVVSERMRGFEQRRAQHTGSGRFITRADLEVSSRSTLANVLRRLPGARIIHGGAAMEEYLATGQSSGPHALNHPPAPCYAQVFVNGVQTYAMGRGDPPNLKEIDVNDIEAIEYYAQPSSTPPQFRTMTADCGTLVLWTRYAR